jgi:TPR repeat protein
VKLIALSCTPLLLAAASLLPVTTLASSATPKMKCTVGPVTKQYGKTPWLVYSCEDGKSILIASEPTNKSIRFRFTILADDDGYALHGEGQGDKRITDSAYQDLNSLSEADIAALVSETRKASGAAAQDTPVEASRSTATTFDPSNLISAKRNTSTGEDYGRLLNADTPLQERQALFADLETAAQEGNPNALYVVGSLYRVGTTLSASPVARDLVKARLYLSNAATHGKVLAMAKMAEIEAESKNSVEAMTWAQIYGHYALLQPQAFRPPDGYLAELVDRASRGVSKAQLQDVVDHLNAFITDYDGQVQSGAQKLNTVAPDLAPTYIPNYQISYPSSGYVPPAGFADFLVAFERNGTVKDI